MLSLAQSLSDNSRLAQTHAWKSNHLTRVGMYQQAMLEGQKAFDLANVAGNKSNGAAAQIAIGEASAFLGRKDQTLRHFSSALKYYEEHGHRVGHCTETQLTAQGYL